LVKKQITFAGVGGFFAHPINRKVIVFNANNKKA